MVLSSGRGSKPAVTGDKTLKNSERGGLFCLFSFMHLFDCVCLCQALYALDRALQQSPIDLTVRAELYFSKGNHLREMNQLDQAFEVLLSTPPNLTKRKVADIKNT